MLCELYISNFALIDEITLQFDQGLNIFTGTTGVGKSLIIGALNFLLGSRATNEIVGNHKNEVSVSGVFYIKNKHVLRNIKELTDIFDDSNDEDVIIQRILDQNGRSKCRLNSQPITVSLLKEIGEILVNIHGQHEHESLTKPIQQLITLDGFGKLDVLRVEFNNIYDKAVEKEKLLHSLKNHLSDRERQIDLYQHEINEIENAQLKPNEDVNIEEECNILSNSEKIQNTLSLCSEYLYESENSIIERLREIANKLSEIKNIDKSFENTAEVCSQSIYQLEDIASTLRNDVEKYNFDQNRLEQVEERIEVIKKLKYRYGDSIEKIVSYFENIKAKLEILLKENDGIGTIEKELNQLEKRAFDVGNRLTQGRKRASKKLSALIKGELAELGIIQGLFEINVSAVNIANSEQPAIKDIHRTGFDRVEFMFSSNQGESLKPLRKIASGGEISRIMLALKRHLALADQTPVLIFDEIDANIGGRMGRVIGEKLRLVSQSHQVVCITHLPQIASYAEQHFKVNKSTRRNKTFVTIDELSEKERLEEIAEMIRGEEKTDVTRKQAKEMLDDARKFLKS